MSGFKTWLWMGALTALLLVQCTEEGPITSSNPGDENTDEPSIEQPGTSGEGGVAFTFRKSGTTDEADTAGLLSYDDEVEGMPDPTNVRVVIRRFEETDWGSFELKYNTLGDVEVPSDTTLTLRVPAGENYQIDAFSYIYENENNKYLLKHRQVRSVDVVADSTTNVSLTLEPIVPEFAIPDSVGKGDEFIVSVSFDSFGLEPIRNENPEIIYQHEMMSKINWSNHYRNSLVSYLPDQEYGDNHPYYDTEGTTRWKLRWELSESEKEEQFIYYQTQFHLLDSDGYYKSDEDNLSFKFLYPNPWSVNDTLKTYITAPDGGIGVSVQY